MNRLKNYWDEIHPQLSFFTSTNLRDQDSRVEKRKIAMSTQNIEINAFHTSNNNETQNVDEPTINDVLDQQQTIELPNEYVNDPIKESLATIFKRNYDSYIHKCFSDRTIDTTTNKKINKNLLNKANDVMRNHLNNIENVTLWEINCAIYRIALTCKELNNDVTTSEKRKIGPPKWITSIESSINRIRKLISCVQVVIKCKGESTFTKHQKTLLHTLKKKFDNSKMNTLETKLTSLKQELKNKSDNLRNQKRLIERKKINKQFAFNPKKIYRNMKGDKTEVDKIPTKERIEQFWKDIWQDNAIFNEKADWLKDLNDTYCKNVVNTEYKIDLQILEKSINKIQINKAPGQDRIIGFWFKNLSSYRDILAVKFNKLLHSDRNTPLPMWLSTARTSLLPKNKETHIAKNYRPIACLNIMYKLCTSCLNKFISDHVYKNNIITQEQTSGKRGVWGMLEQLLINKNIMNEVRRMRRNSTTIWLDYRKAFDSIPHSWLIKSLKLAKVPDDILNALENLTQSWYTILHLNGNNENVASSLIKISKGIYQGDSLSVMLFVLSLNPLSHLLRMRKGYTYSKNRQYHHTHNFFVDDLKLFATNMSNIKCLLDIVTLFSKGTGMKFGVNDHYQQVILIRILELTKI